MKLLLELLTPLFESDYINIANGGNNSMVIEDKDGQEIDTIHSFNKIMTRFLEKEVYAKNNRLTPEVIEWYGRNFTNWLKRGAKGAAMDDLAFGHRYYQSVDDYINNLVATEPGKISYDEVLNQFPDYIKKDVSSSVIFSGGRLFRLNKLIPTINNLSDYLLANQAASANPERAANIIPPQLFVGTKFANLQAPEALEKSKQWHLWVEKNAERVTREQLLQDIAKLKQGTDFVVDMKFPDGSQAVKLLSCAGTDLEGRAMKHCVASYGKDLEAGRVTLYSIRDPEGIPRVTILWDDKNKKAEQVKGPRNSTVPNEVLPQTLQWLVSKGIRNSNDLSLMKVKSVEEIYDKVKKHAGSQK